MRRIYLVLFALASTLAACSSSDESAVEATVDDLVDALNDRDTASLARLFSDGSVAPVSPAGDSSVVYRLATIPGGSGFEAGNVVATVIEDRAQAQFDLAGSVERGDQVMGEMTMRVGLDLERSGEQWRIVPGSDRMLSTW